MIISLRNFGIFFFCKYINTNTKFNSTSGSGRVGIKVFQLIEGGGEASKEVKNSSVSRIKFGVHVDRWTKKENSKVNKPKKPAIDNYE